MYVTMYVTWLICMCWRIYMCAMTYLYVWHDAFTCVTWLILRITGGSESKAFTGDMTHQYVWHGWFVWVTWRIYKCDVTYLYVWLDSSLSLQEALSYRPVGLTRHVTDSCVRHDSFVCGCVGVVCVYMYAYTYICLVGLGDIYIYTDMFIYI